MNDIFETPLVQRAKINRTTRERLLILSDGNFLVENDASNGFNLYDWKGKLVRGWDYQHNYHFVCLRDNSILISCWNQYTGCLEFLSAHSRASISITTFQFGCVKDIMELKDGRIVFFVSYTHGTRLIACDATQLKMDHNTNTFLDERGYHFISEVDDYLYFYNENYTHRYFRYDLKNLSYKDCINLEGSTENNRVDANTPLNSHKKINYACLLEKRYLVYLCDEKFVSFYDTKNENRLIFHFRVEDGFDAFFGCEKKGVIVGKIKNKSDVFFWNETGLLHRFLPGFEYHRMIGFDEYRKLCFYSEDGRLEMHDIIYGKKSLVHLCCNFISQNVELKALEDILPEEILNLCRCFSRLSRNKKKRID